MLKLLFNIVTAKIDLGEYVSVCVSKESPICELIHVLY
jgi:hypothetical protein